VLSWGADKLRPTAVTMNLGIFGAVALGPVVGGAAAGTWRPLPARGSDWLVLAGAALVRRRLVGVPVARRRGARDPVSRVLALTRR
jgi:hypothetical protein